MILCCPHPDPVHDQAGDCTVLHCGCHRIEAGVRCACPYADCWTLVTKLGEICPPCTNICVVADGIDPRPPKQTAN